jgi:peptidoglycan/xylan/chitin deacetylase (PgdA/CDA1 family)
MISIVIPALNEERLLPGCLESLRNQDYRGEHEIIIADNGSTDRTASIARNFGAKVIPCSEEKSVFHARQVGADSARGDIIVQADADTIYPKGWLSRIASQFAAHPEAVAITGRYVYRDRPFWAPLEYLYRTCVNVLSSFLLRRPLIVSGATFAFRRQAFVKGNGYRGLTYSADQYGIAMRLSKLGRVLYDRHLYVLTSSRAVQKPFMVLVLDCLVNIAKLMMYLSQDGANALRTLSARSRARRIATGILPLLTTFIVLLMGYFIPSSPVFGKVYSKVKLNEKVVALTFDDGPNEPYTSEILDILDRYDIKATFFVVGENVKRYPETSRRIVSEGSVLGNHSYSHNANHALSNFGSIDMAEAETVIYNTAGVKPHLYRPPHGKKSPWELREVKEEKMVTVMWSDATNEQHEVLMFGKPSPIVVANQIIHEAKPGEIIILHDGYGTNHNDAKSDKTITVQALPIIIEVLQAKGYRFETVPELLNVAPYKN